MKRFLNKRTLRSVVPQHIDYPNTHLHSLPLELILEVLDFVAGGDASKTLLNVSLTCSKLHSIVNEYYLYKEVKLLSQDGFHDYCDSHLSKSQSYSLTKRFKIAVTGETSKIRFLTVLHLSNPPSKVSDNNTAKIAGTYDVENINGRDSHQTYLEYMLSLSQILKRAKHLREIKLCEISPSFEFPDTDLKIGFTTRKLQRLILVTQTGWSLPFKANQISLIMQYFGTIENLSLFNFIIDESKLTSTSLHPCKIVQLGFDSCKFIRKHGARKQCQLFAQVSTLKLYNIQNDSDLSLIDFIKQNNKLVALLLDFHSGIFYLFTISSKMFNFTKFNHFFKLLCLRKGGFGTLNELILVNFDLFDLQAADERFHHTEQVDTWHEPTPLENFLSYVGLIPRLRIVLKSDPETCPLLEVSQDCNLSIETFNGKVLKRNIEV